MCVWGGGGGGGAHPLQPPPRGSTVSRPDPKSTFFELGGSDKSSTDDLPTDDPTKTGVWRA